MADVDFDYGITPPPPDPIYTEPTPEPDYSWMYAPGGPLYQPPEPYPAPTEPAPAAPTGGLTGPGGPLYQPEGTTAPDFFAPLAQSPSLAPLAQAYSSPSPTPYSFESNPLVAYAKAEQAKGLTSLDGWLKGQSDLANAQGGTAKARLKRQRDLAHRALLNRLAARGILRSGELGYQEGQQSQEFSDRNYDVDQNILQQLASYMSQYLQQKNSLRSVLDNAYQTAYQTQVQQENLPTNGPGANGGSLFAPTASANIGSIDEYLWRRR